MRKLLLLAWLPLLIFLYPLPPEAARQFQAEIHQSWPDKAASSTPSQSQLDMFTSALWEVWIQNLLWAVVGVAIGFMAWRGYRYWQWLALGMSIIYLAFVALQYVFMDSAIPDSWLFFETKNHFLRVAQANLRLVEVSMESGSLKRPAYLLYHVLLMPVFQVAVLAWLATRLGARRP